MPGESSTTCPAGQASRADWIAGESSPPDGVSVRQIVLRTGIPPAAIMPGVHTVARSAGRMLVSAAARAVRSGASVPATAKSSRALVSRLTFSLDPPAKIRIGILRGAAEDEGPATDRLLPLWTSPPTISRCSSGRVTRS